jgi:hypothetical protein
MPIKTYNLGDVNNVYSIDPSDYTNFFGEIDGIFYPYIEFEYDEGYTCERCNGGCPRDVAPSTTVKIVVWEHD